MKTGVVKFYAREKSYGFICDNETGKDIFVHSTGLVDAIHEGDSVTYDVQEGKKGLNATNVKLATANSSANSL